MQAMLKTTGTPIEGSCGADELFLGLDVVVQEYDNPDKTLFVIHPISGIVSFDFSGVVTAMKTPKLRVVCIDSAHTRMPKNTRRENLNSIENIAAGCLPIIKKHQTTGPYYIFGYSFGFIVAYHLARQLNAIGDTIAMLSGVDSRGPCAYERMKVIDKNPTMIKQIEEWEDCIAGTVSELNQVFQRNYTFSLSALQKQQFSTMTPRIACEKVFGLVSNGGKKHFRIDSILFSTLLNFKALISYRNSPAKQSVIDFCDIHALITEVRYKEYQIMEDKDPESTDMDNSVYAESWKYHIAGEKSDNPNSVVKETPRNLHIHFLDGLDHYSVMTTPAKLAAKLDEIISL